MRKVKCFLLVLFFIFVLVAVATAVEITQVGKVVAPHPNTGEEFLILISDNFWQVPEVQEAIERYQDDVYRHRQIGSRVFATSPPELPLVSPDGIGGDYEAAYCLRSFIQNEYYSSGKNLVGVVLIGDIPWVLAKIHQRYYDSCNEFFGDMDGEYTVVSEFNSQLLYIEDDLLYDCEIWVSRILPPVMIPEFVWTEDGYLYREHDFSFLERKEMLIKFFQKDHCYWENEDNWCGLTVLSFANACEKIIDQYSFLTGEKICLERGVTKEEVLDSWKNRSRIIEIGAHGSDSSYFLDWLPEEDDRRIDAWEIYNTEINGLIVHSYSCGSLNFTRYSGSLGQSFLFGKSQVISVIGLSYPAVGNDKGDKNPVLMIGDLWKEKTRGNFDRFSYGLMGDPFILRVPDIVLPAGPNIFEVTPIALKFGCSPADERMLTLLIEEKNLKLELYLPAFKAPVDIYVGVDAKPLDGFFIWTQNGIILWDGSMSSLIPYKREWVNGLEEVIFEGNVTDLPSGDYYGYLLAVPSGTDLSSFDWNSSLYYLWYWHWQK